MATVDEIIVNRTTGLTHAEDLTLIEGANPPLQMVGSDLAGQPVDWTGCTVDEAVIVGDHPRGPVLATLTVTLGADGLVTIDVPELTLSTADWPRYPNGRGAIISVRLLSPTGQTFYLIRPSHLTIENAPGATT